ncbi:hypothetical protein SLS62_007592 [Diatrype stigma]|uniref:Major facilitator superfamily transporter n=1 Tax=Diatrype stigma TaxID=117547 RepID=A0AAN9YM76_9PEZI
MSRPESTGSTIDISEIEKSFPEPPRLSVSVRKTLPPLPAVLESPRASPSPTYESPLSSPRSVSSPTWPGSATKLLIPSQGEPIREIPGPLDFKLGFIPPPPPPASLKDRPRPVTASTKTLSYASAETKRTIKYGTGKSSGVELSPQPSDDPLDPLNWPIWRKHLNFMVLLLIVTLIGVMKTAFISSHSAVAMRYNVSYTTAVALTAVPLMVSAFTGLLSSIVARIVGKRPVYFVSILLMFTGVMLNINMLGSFSEHMIARVFQGLGWGAFETLVLSSIQDTYFEHERQLKTTIYHIVATASTWGSPLLGGVVSASPHGFTRQFKIIGGFLSIAILLLVFGAPETVFDRSSYYPTMPATARAEAEARWPHVEFTGEAARAYLAKMKPWPFYRAAEPVVDWHLVLQAPRALVAPTTALLFIATMLPHVGLWSLASCLALLFSPMPFMLTAPALGVLMTGPFLLTTAAAVAATFAFPHAMKRFTRTVHVAAVATGTAVASAGLFAFGLYIQGTMQIRAPSPASASANAGSPWDLGYLGDRLSFPVASLLLGLVGAGSLVLDAAVVRPAIQQSTAFTSPSLLVGLRNTADMHGALACLRSLAAGAFVLAVPGCAWSWDGLRAVAVGLGAAQIAAAAGACAAWWWVGETVKRWDGRVMGLVDLDLLRKQVSFFDTT